MQHSQITADFLTVTVFTPLHFPVRGDVICGGETLCVFLVGVIGYFGHQPFDERQRAQLLLRAQSDVVVIERIAEFLPVQVQRGLRAGQRTLHAWLIDLGEVAGIFTLVKRNSRLFIQVCVLVWVIIGHSHPVEFQPVFGLRIKQRFPIAAPHTRLHQLFHGLAVAAAPQRADGLFNLGCQPYRIITSNE